METQSMVNTQHPRTMGTNTQLLTEFSLVYYTFCMIRLGISYEGSWMMDEHLSLSSSRKNLSWEASLINISMLLFYTVQDIHHIASAFTST
jgi:hypothetical protein